MVLTTIKLNNEWRIFDTLNAHSREDAESVVKRQREWDSIHIKNTSYDYFIFEALVISKEKIKEIITNSNVQ